MAFKSLTALADMTYVLRRMVTYLCRRRTCPLALVGRSSGRAVDRSLVLALSVLAVVAFAAPAQAAWVSLGTSPGNGGTANPSSALAWDGTRLWAAYNDGSYNVQVKYWNGSVWTAITSPGGGGTEPTNPSIVWDGTRLYVAYVNSSRAIQFKYWDGTVWQNVGTSVDLATYNPEPTLSWNGTSIDMAYQDDTRTVKVVTWNGVAWAAHSTVSTSQSANTYPAIRWDGVQLWSAYNDSGNDVQVRQYVASAWASISSPFAGTVNTLPALEWAGTKMFAAWSDAGYLAQVGYWTGTSWRQVPSMGGGSGVNFAYPALAWSGSTLYGAYTDSAENVQVKAWDNAPWDAASLAQFRADGTTPIASGSWTTDGASTTIQLKFSISHPLSSQTLTPWVEVRPSTGTFSAACGTSVAGVTFSGAAITVATGGDEYQASVPVTGLASGATYMWRACTVDGSARASGWTAMGGTPDFGVDNAAPPAPVQVSPANADRVVGTPALTATYADAAPASPGWIDFELCADSGCGSSLATGSSATGLASGTNGTFTPSNLAPGTYWWRARAVDSALTAGPWSGTWSFTLLPTVSWLSGFEHQTISTAGGGLFSAVTGAPTIDTVVRRTGSASLRLASTGPATQVGIGAGGAATVVRLALRFQTLPTAASDLVEFRAAAGDSAFLTFDPATSRLSTRWGNGVAGAGSGPALTTGQWFRVEARVRLDLSPRTIEWSVDGVAGSAPNSTAQGGSVASGIYLGHNGSGPVYDLNVDDVVVSTTATDYPIGDGRVLAYRPDSSGTHVNPGDFRTSADDATTLATPVVGETTSWDLINEWPVTTGTGADLIEQATANTASYVAHGFENDLESTPPVAIRSYLAMRNQSGPTTNKIKAALTDDAGTSLAYVVGSATTTYAVPSTTLSYAAATMPTKPSGGAWTTAAFDALQSRWGFGEDTGPVPRVDSALVEAYFAIPPNLAPTVPTHVSPANGSTTADTTPTLSATFADPDVGQTGLVSYEVCTVAMAAGQSCLAAGGAVSASGNSASGVAIGASGPWTPLTALATGTYHWHARNEDQYGVLSGWSASWQLRIGAPTMTLSVDAATVSLGLLSAGVDATGTSALSITTDSAGGYQLAARDESDTWGAADAGGGTIVDWTGTSASPTTWAGGFAGGMGMSVLTVTGPAAKNAKWGTGATATDFVLNRYAGLKATTDTIVHDRPNYASTTDVITVGWRMNMAGSQAAGSYGATVVWTALALP